MATFTFGLSVHRLIDTWGCLQPLATMSHPAVNIDHVQVFVWRVSLGIYRSLRGITGSRGNFDDVLSCCPKGLRHFYIFTGSEVSISSHPRQHLLSF